MGAPLATCLPCAEVDHGLDREDVPRLHDPLSLVLGVVRNRGDGVEQLADAVAAVGLDHLATYPSASAATATKTTQRTKTVAPNAYTAGDR